MFPSKEQVEQVRLTFPRGTLVECIFIDDPYVTIPPVTIGEVTDVDATGTVFVIWRNGISIGAVCGVDKIRRIENADSGL